ncbi:MAG: ThuA domain-containing protein [Chthoniobacter sp.]|nr:ThuA domain-containing protein [Chthoniobacter sp.]
MKKILLTLSVLALTLTPLLSVSAVEPKRVIVCTVTTGFRHGSIPFAEKTLKKLGEESKAYTVVDMAQQPTTQITKSPAAPKKPADLAADADDAAKAKHAEEIKKFEADTAKWADLDKKAKESKAQWDAEMKASMAKLSPENLVAQKIDAVIFANTTGDLPLPDRDGFIKWVESGHGFCGMHSAGDTFHGFPGYLGMLQAEFKGHGRQVPADLIAGDKTHPANGAIGETWNLTQEEMYEFKDGSHDRAKIRALWYLRHHPQDPNKLGYAPVSWCRLAGKGHVFYTSLGHREDLWDDTDAVKDRKNSVEISKQYQAHILGGIKWALGLASGSAEANPDAK